MSDLKSCPFCGGEAIRDIEENSGGSYIRCTHCNASSALHFDRCENLYEDWNIRPPIKDRLVEAVNSMEVRYEDLNGGMYINRDNVLKAINSILDE